MKLFTTPIAIRSSLIMLSLLTTAVTAKTWECGERSNLPLEGRNYCAAGDFRQSEIDLRNALDALLKKYIIAFGDASAMSNAQSAFELYRDNQCSAENKHIEDKPFYPMIVAQCKTRMTNLRIDEIKRMQNFEKR